MADIYRLHALIPDMESAAYHSTPNTYSSTQLKDCEESMEIFFKKHIEKSIPKETNGAFDVGSYFHTGVLEPHKITKEFIVYPGSVRRGDKFEFFQKKHAAKTIMTAKQVEQAKGLISAAQDSPIAMGYIKRGKPEISTFLQIHIWRGEIYATAFGLMLGKNGWETASDEWNMKTVGRLGRPMVIKCRADSLGDDYILDLKSTSGNVQSDRDMRNKISNYSYDLSASLYLDVFSAVTKKTYRKFYWTFASKEFGNCQTYLASGKNILVGRVKYRKALLKIAEGLSSGWEFSDSVRVLEPNAYELEHLQESDSDLL